MKLALAASVALIGAASFAPAPVRAESSYWEERWRGGDSTPEYRQKRYRGRDHVDIRVHKRPRAYRDRRGYPERSYNGPVYQSQEQVQQSVYEFATGGVGDINSYR
jgi:hypothetical protein